MSLKGINHIIFAFILSFFIITYLFITESCPFIHIPTLALVLFFILIFFNHQQRQDRGLEFHKLIRSSGPHNSQGSTSPIFLQGLDQIPESIIILNGSRQVIYHNRSAVHLFGLKQNMTCTGCLVEQAFHLDGKQLTAIGQVLSKGEKEENRQTLSIEGETRSFLHRIDPISENGMVQGLLLYSKDISSGIWTQQETQTANMVKNKILANIRHELRTPLIGFMGAVELLERNEHHDSELDNIRIISECGEKLLQIIDRMLTVSRVELGAGDCQHADCNIKSLLQEILSSIYPSLKEKGLDMDWYIEPNVPEYLVLDGVKLQQILANILSNAVKYTRQGGIACRVKYEQNGSNSWISISISDTGIGIAEDQLSKILSPFSQVDNSCSRQYQGIGLGLYLCRKLLEVMDGELRIESQVGKGSTFHIKLPVLLLDQSHSKSVSSRPNPMEEDELPFGFNPLRILVVDDNHLTLNIVTQILHNYGFQTEVASNGLEALDLLPQNRFDLLLMDMQMPLMDGYQATMNIRAQSTFQSLPIIAMTANSTPNAREKCLSSGCNAYIAKPFKAEELMNEIANCFKNNIPKSPGEVERKLIAELIPDFLDSLYESIQELDVAVKSNDLEGVKNISHDIKGSAGLYGFHEISRTAAKIEQAAGANESQAINSSFTQLCDLYKKLGA